MLKHELRNVLPKLGAHLDIDPGVLSRVNAAQACFRRNSAVAGKSPHNPWQDVGCETDVILIPEEFSAEHGTLTPTMKLRRRAIEERYRSVIDEMYTHAEAVPVTGHVSG